MTNLARSSQELHLELRCRILCMGTYQNEIDRLVERSGEVRQQLADGNWAKEVFLFLEDFTHGPRAYLSDNYGWVLWVSMLETQEEAGDGEERFPVPVAKFEISEMQVNDGNIPARLDRYILSNDTLSQQPVVVYVTPQQFLSYLDNLVDSGNPLIKLNLDR